MTSLVETFDCCGVRIAALSPAEAVEQLCSLARAAESKGVHLCNAYTLSLATGDDEFSRLLNDGALNFADGAPVAWVGRLLGHVNVTGPVRGSRLMLDSMREGIWWEARHYLYGGTPATVETLRRRLPELVPGIDLVGYESPPFRELTAAEQQGVIARVRDSGAHFVWVGLGTPKQDRFVSSFQSSWDAVTVGVGAAFNFASGTVKEAPQWMHGTGLEWVYRLWREPRRLWRRYLFGNARFMMGVLTKR